MCRASSAPRVTKVERLEHLVASHTKPWRDSTNEERLNGENGLLLTPAIDHLFDKGFISFEDKGALVVSPVADRQSLLTIVAERPPNWKKIEFLVVDDGGQALPMLRFGPFAMTDNRCASSSPRATPTSPRSQPDSYVIRRSRARPAN